MRPRPEARPEGSAESLGRVAHDEAFGSPETLRVPPREFILSVAKDGMVFGCARSAISDVLPPRQLGLLSCARFHPDAAAACTLCTV